MNEYFNKAVKLISLVFLLAALSTSASAATPLSIYKCKVNTDTSNGWIPSKFQIGIRNNRAKIKFPKGYDTPPNMNDVRVLRNNDSFKEISFTIDQYDSKNQRMVVVHNVTILPKSNNKVVYISKFKHFNNHHEARGRCVVELRYK